MPDIQRSLFAGYPTTNVATANNPRQDAIDRAFEKADKGFSRQVRAVPVATAALYRTLSQARSRPALRSVTARYRRRRRKDWVSCIRR
jgi:hypothetical protein